MTGARVAQLARGGVEVTNAKSRLQRKARSTRGVETIEQLCGARGLREGAHRTAKLAHRDRGLEPMTHDVADDERHGAGEQREGVVPVTADLERRGTGTVGGRDDHVLELRQRPA